ncbi:MAG TPA: hypothetical protein VNJ10_10660 [Sphingomonas sp.]|nr:hypothetical protein [Sphingomonas sp.]
MVSQHDENGLLREAIETALLLADDRQDHLVAALLAHCLDELDRQNSSASR